MTDLGRHIAIYGPTSSGKSTLAKRIAQSTGLPHVELDAIFWLPGWVERPLDEFRAEVSTALSKCPDGWVIDGNYSRVRDLTLPLTDTVIWLRPPFRVAFWRLLKRSVCRSLDHKLICGENRETWRQGFFSRKSLLLYQVTHWRRYDQKITHDLETIPHHARIVQLHSQSEIENFLVGLRKTGVG